jgi:hypothetical protein
MRSRHGTAKERELRWLGHHRSSGLVASAKKQRCSSAGAVPLARNVPSSTALPQALADRLHCRDSDCTRWCVPGMTHAPAPGPHLVPLGVLHTAARDDLHAVLDKPATRDLVGGIWHAGQQPARGRERDVSGMCSGTRMPEGWEGGAEALSMLGTLLQPACLLNQHTTSCVGHDDATRAAQRGPPASWHRSMHHVAYHVASHFYFTHGGHKAARCYSSRTHAHAHILAALSLQPLRHSLL